jgi:hypothetical protein
MDMNFVKAFIITSSELCSLSVFADTLIEVEVIATDKVAAIGYLVEGQKSGGLGKRYAGTGPMNKKYTFGYRKKVIGGEDITCGTLVLNKNARVKMVVKDEQCYTLID